MITMSQFVLGIHRAMVMVQDDWQENQPKPLLESMFVLPSARRSGSQRVYGNPGPATVSPVPKADAPNMAAIMKRHGRPGRGFLRGKTLASARPSDRKEGHG